MPVSDDAKAVVEAITRKMDEHELLVRIDERGKGYERDIKHLFASQAEETTKRTNEIEDIRIKFGTELSMVSKDVKGVLRIRDMVSGAVGLLGFVGLLMTILISYFKLSGGS